ncbi:MAG: hypothetical protein JXX29_09950 [Deltaproteobacteria bacterium]|nr:hypothetical protein [Deltaproteobacteria bacterium]MBN2671988.1 hypothetical protein [Deltaproteobacteria bacterium]
MSEVVLVKQGVRRTLRSGGIALVMLMIACNPSAAPAPKQDAVPKKVEETESKQAVLKRDAATSLGALAEYVAEEHLSGEDKADWLNYAAHVFALSKDQERAKSLFKRAQWARHDDYNIPLPAEVGYVEESLAAVEKMKNAGDKKRAMARIIPAALAFGKKSLVESKFNMLSPAEKLDAMISASKRCFSLGNMACAKQYFEEAATVGKSVLTQSASNTRQKELAMIAIDVGAMDAHPWLFDNLHPLSVVEVIEHAVVKEQVSFGENLLKKLKRNNYETVAALTLLAGKYHESGDLKKFDSAYGQAAKKVSAIREKCRFADAVGMLAGLDRLKGADQQKEARIAEILQIIQQGVHFGSGFDCHAAEEPFRRLAHGGICDVQVANANLLPDWKSESALMAGAGAACIQNGDLKNGAAIFEKADELEKTKNGGVYSSDVFRAWLNLGEFEKARQYLTVNHIDPLHKDVMFVISGFVHRFIRQDGFAPQSEKTKALTSMLYSFFAKSND